MFVTKCAVCVIILNFVSAQEDIITENNVNYRFFPVKKSTVSFKVDARNDAYVALSKHPRLSVPMYELILGGWGNTKTVLKRFTCLPREKDEAQTPQILNDQEFRGFWIRWDNGNILVGREGEDNAFMSWQDPKPFAVAYAGVRTTWGSNGNWKLANGSRYNGGNENGIAGLAQLLPGIDFVCARRTGLYFHTPDWEAFVKYIPTIQIRFDVATEAEHEAQYFPMAGSALHFKVRGSNDVTIELTSQPRQTDPMYEIVIGGWRNTKSVIRKYVCHIVEKDEKQTPKILNDKEFREFWLRWDHGNVLVGRQGEAQPFLSWQDPEPVHVAYVGVRTTWGSTGNWKLAGGSNNGGDSVDVATENDPKWQFFPIPGDSLKIKVRASNDATIGLATHPWETDPMYEVVLGGWRNTKSVLRRFCCLNPEKAKAETPQILKSGDFQGFWLRWDGGNFLAGREGETDHFISWHDPEPFHVAFIGVHTGFGSRGVWKIEDITTKDIIEPTHKEKVDKPVVCAPTLTRLRQGIACAGQTVFEENFDTLREDMWQVQQYVPIDHHELPFVSYQRSTVSVKHGNLRIAATLQQTQPGFTHSSIFDFLDLYKGCTSGQSSSCYVDARDGSTVIPPVVSGRLTSRSSFAFTYGVISVRAKLPVGDWIYPEILLEPFSKKFIYGTKNSGILKIACARGNKMLSNGTTQYGNKVLYSGPVIDTKCHDTLLATKTSGKFWGDDFHVYSVKWTPERLILSVDGEEYARVEPASGGLRARLPNTCAGPQQPGIAPFNEHFYITLGLAAGGHSEFPDMCLTRDNHVKPWRNHASKAALNFWNDMDAWYDTWDRPDLLIDYVRVVAL